MSFVCEECMKKAGYDGFLVSFGPCEDCGKNRPCSNVKSSRLPHSAYDSVRHEPRDDSTDKRRLMEIIDRLRVGLIENTLEPDELILVGELLEWHRNWKVSN